MLLCPAPRQWVLQLRFYYLLCGYNFVFLICFVYVFDWHDPACLLVRAIYHHFQINGCKFINLPPNTSLDNDHLKISQFNAAFKIKIIFQYVNSQLHRECWLALVPHLVERPLYFIYLFSLFQVCLLILLTSTLIKTNISE